MTHLLEGEPSGGPRRAPRRGTTLVRQGLRHRHHDEEHVQNGDGGGGGNDQVLAVISVLSPGFIEAGRCISAGEPKKQEKRKEKKRNLRVSKN